MLDDATTGASTRAPRCNWCSAELPSDHEVTCPSCGATLLGDGDPSRPRPDRDRRRGDPAQRSIGRSRSRAAACSRGSAVTTRTTDRRSPPRPARWPRRRATSGARCSGSSSRPRWPTPRPRPRRWPPTPLSRRASPSSRWPLPSTTAADAAAALRRRRGPAVPSRGRGARRSAEADARRRRRRPPAADEAPPPSAAALPIRRRPPTRRCRRAWTQATPGRSPELCVIGLHRLRLEPRTSADTDRGVGTCAGPRRGRGRTSLHARPAGVAAARARFRSIRGTLRGRWWAARNPSWRARTASGAPRRVLVRRRSTPLGPADLAPLAPLDPARGQLGTGPTLGYRSAVPDRLPSPGPSFLREQADRDGGRNLRLGMSQPTTHRRRLVAGDHLGDRRRRRRRRSSSSRRPVGRARAAARAARPVDRRGPAAA